MGEERITKEFYNVVRLSKNHSFIKKYPSTKKTISHNLGCLSLIFQVIGFLFTNLKPEMKSHSFFYSFFFILFITLLFFF